MPQNLADALGLVEKAEEYQADFIEVRLDYMDEFEKLKDIAGCAKAPLIATVRAPQHHGKFLGKEEERIKVLLNSASNGFDFVDIELDSPLLKDVVGNLVATGVKPIISFHDFEKTPENSKLRQVLKSELAIGADVCKIVTTAQTLQDNLNLLYFLNSEGGKARIVCFAMGALGKLSRLLSPIFGGYFTVASLKRGMETASGQMTIKEMRKVYKALGVV